MLPFAGLKRGIADDLKLKEEEGELVMKSKEAASLMKTKDIAGPAMNGE